jgi:hypothetical protein
MNQALTTYGGCEATVSCILNLDNKRKIMARQVLTQLFNRWRMGSRIDMLLCRRRIYIATTKNRAMLSRSFKADPIATPTY